MCFDRLAGVAELDQGVDADFQVLQHIASRDGLIALTGLDPFGRHRVVRDQEQRALGDVVDEPDDEDRGGLHVDCRGADRL